MFATPVMSACSEQEVFTQLERILADRRFANAERNSRFLRYIVERTLAGDNESLKEIVVAMEIYGRSADYDSKTDSVVRVEASRLRAKLDSYYRSEGSGDAIRILIPKGAYVAQFERVPCGSQEPAPVDECVSQEVTPGPVLPPPAHAVEPAPGPVLVPVGEGRPAPRWAGGLAVVLSATLAVFLSGKERQSDAVSAEALSAWREGNELLRQDPHSGLVERGMPPILARALERYQFAVARDPQFAEGWAAVAEAYDYASAYVGRNREDDARRAEEAARRAVQLNPSLPYAHAMLGTVLFYLRFDFRGAEQAYRRAIALEPRSHYAVVEYVDLLRETGRLPEAEEELRKARALQPALPVLAVKEAELRLDRKQPDAAVAVLEDVLRNKHDIRRAHVILGAAWEAKGEDEKALASYRTALDMNRRDRRALPALGYLLAKLNRKEEALAVARELEQIHTQVRLFAVQIATVYAGLGDTGKVLHWLEQAYQTRQAHLPFAAIDYRFASLRLDPTFTAILGKVGVKPVAL